MEEIAYKQVFHYIQQHTEPVSPHELSRVTGKSRVSIHAALKKLMASGDIEKHGVSPRVTYTIKGVAPLIPIDLTTENIVRAIDPILKKYPISYAGILGPVSHTERGSVLNMMISFREQFSLVALKAIEQSITEVLGIKVDLITDQGANKYLKTSMLSKLQIVYGSV
jgi:predicted nucleotidyltransferase/biotin operon repressor